MTIETATAITENIIAITRSIRNTFTTAMRGGCKKTVRGRAVRAILVAILLAASTFTQDKSAVTPPACGPRDISFDVKRDNSQHTLAQPEPRKALVYFVQDIGEVSCIGGCGTTKVGLDGAWVGANQHNSYFFVSVEPGEHHVCVKPQSGSKPERIQLAHFTAESGKIYYFRSRAISGSNQLLFDLDPIDSDQGKYLVDLYPLSVSHAK